MEISNTNQDKADTGMMQNTLYEYIIAKIL